MRLHTHSHLNGKRRSEPGFTLIELAITLAIVGILASVGGSQYTVYLDRARMARAIVELRGLSGNLDLLVLDGLALPATLSDADLQTNDPWGNPYQYLPLQGNLPPGLSSTEPGLPHVAAAGGGKPAIALARKDKFLVPINSDYDLYSMGPDGETHPSLNVKGGKDDVIRAANGSFYGLAEKF
jgi:general secretion pathway protein G